MTTLTLHIDPATVRVKHLRAFGRAKSFDDMVAWLVTHAGAGEAELDELTLAELIETQKSFFEQLKEQSVPKANSAS